MLFVGGAYEEHSISLLKRRGKGGVALCGLNI
jgi:hypothetical protein